MKTSLDSRFVAIIRFVLWLSAVLAGARLAVRVAATVLSFWRAELADLLTMFV